MTPQKKVKIFFGLFKRQKSSPIPYSWTILHFSPVTYYKHTAVLYKNSKPCHIQIFTHLNTGTSRRDKKDKMAKRNQMGIFLGGGGLRAVLKSDQYLRMYVSKSIGSWCDW